MTAAGRPGARLTQGAVPGWDTRSGDGASRHPVNRLLVDAAPLPERVADRAVGLLGSWRFMAVQTVIVLIWIVGNAYLWFHFDPYPFILLNLAFSTEAAYAAPTDPSRQQPGSGARPDDARARGLGGGYRGRPERATARGRRYEILAHVEVLEHRILDLERSILEALADRPRRPVTPSSPADPGQPGA